MSKRTTKRRASSTPINHTMDGSLYAAAALGIAEDGDALQMVLFEEDPQTRKAEYIAKRMRRKWGFPSTPGVYFAQETSPQRLIKIGLAKDFNRRLPSFFTHCPYPVRLLAWMPGDKKLESEVHALFWVHRFRGEWFYPHPDIFGYIEPIRWIASE